MRVMHLMVVLMVANSISWTAGAASGQSFPAKPLRIVTGDVGGGTDFASRLIGAGLTAALGQPVIVDNRGAAGAAIAGQTVAKAQPDGYTLLLYGSTIWLSPFLRDHVPYDPVEDFSPVTLAVSLPHMLVTNSSLPVSSVKDLIALAKAKPGQLNDASTSTGSPTHLAAELFKAMAGVNIMRVTYKGTTQALNDMIGGQVHLMFVVVIAGMPQVKSGRLKALAITSAQPSALAPGLPTVAGSGVPGFESASVYGLFAPARTPSAVIDKLNQEIVRVLNRSDVKEKFFNAGAEVVGSSPRQFGLMVKSDMVRMGKIIRDAGIRED